MFRTFRILILLLILATVGLSAWRSNSRLTAWENTVHVALYPIAGDDAPSTQAYLAQLDNSQFAEIAEWIQAETQRYGKSLLQPIALQLAPPLREAPPLPPTNRSQLDIALWSLKFRWWASQHDAIAGPKPQVRLFILFHDPARTPQPPHSTGLDKGQIGIVHAFAHRMQRRQNNIVIAHEMLHTFGASDKYNLATLQPIWPQGYAEPDKSPHLPQTWAEIMAGRTPLTETRAEMPASLHQSLIGPETAKEIGLLRSTR